MLLAVLAVLLATPAPHEAQRTDTPVSQEADGDVIAFLDALKAGKGAEGVTRLLSSPLWAQKAGAREAMVGQIDAAVRAYGPVTAYERVRSDRIGTLVMREYYMVQHRDMVTRWEFEIIRSATGWRIANFGFTDQANSWF